MDKRIMALMATQGLTRDQLSGLTRDQLSWLTGDQLSGLTGDQLSGLTREITIPVVDRLYLRIWEDIQADKRKFTCIAGHTVHLAGEPGYVLVHRFGFVYAATLIHRASTTAPLPRYDSYPDEWALAYIEERAKEESDAA